jgi:tyrosyl-tRNA synthetase
MTSPYAFYQFWLNVDDRDLPKLFRYFSLKDQVSIEKLEKENESNPNALKEVLADEITIRIHGDKAWQGAKNVSGIIFNPKADKAQLQNLSVTELNMIAEEIPSFSISNELISKNVSVIDILSEYTTICPSKSEARRAIQSNAISINKDKITDLNQTLATDQLLFGQYAMIENGKKNKYMIVVA